VPLKYAGPLFLSCICMILLQFAHTYTFRLSHKMRYVRCDNNIIIMPSILLLLLLLFLFRIRKRYNVINARFNLGRTIGYWHRYPEIKYCSNGSCAVNIIKKKIYIFLRYYDIIYLPRDNRRRIDKYKS